jgi:hypothetical protein
MSIKDAEKILTGKMIEVYGFSEGLKVSRVLSSAIIGDLYKTAKDSSDFDETYRTEDRKVAVHIAGKIMNGQIIIDKMDV